MNIDSNIYWQYLANRPTQGVGQSLSGLMNAYKSEDQRRAMMEQQRQQREIQAMQIQQAKDAKLRQANGDAIMKQSQFGPWAGGYNQGPSEQDKLRSLAAIDPQRAMQGYQLLDAQQKLNQEGAYAPKPERVTYTYKPGDDGFMYAWPSDGGTPKSTGVKAKEPSGVTIYNGGEQGFKNEMDLRKEVNALPEIKEWTTIDSQVKRLDAAMEEAKSGGNMVAVDQALITIFNKMLDPASVVRESEYARTPGDLALVNRLKGAWDKISTGGAGLTPSDRQGIYRMAKQYGKVAEDKYNSTRKHYENIATSHKFNVDNIFAPQINYGGFEFLGFE